jgi:endonuclease V-like protein UPF0215 family
MLVNLFNIEMPDSQKLDEALNDKFISKEKFAEEIESIVQNTNMNHIDAIVEFCEEKGIEVESVSKLISRPLKEKIKYEAQELNYLKKTSRGKLPL